MVIGLNLLGAAANTPINLNPLDAMASLAFALSWVSGTFEALSFLISALVILLPAAIWLKLTQKW